MRLNLAIVFSLICGPALADESVNITSTTANQTQTQVHAAPPSQIDGHHFCAKFYPEAVHAEGKNTLTFTIEPDGTVEAISVAKSSNNEDLDNAAIQCAQHWPYGPARLNDNPIRTPSRIDIVWKLSDSPAAMRAAQCLTDRGHLSVPPGAAETSITYLVTSDGAAKNIATARSSGDKSLDDAAMLCVAADRFDTSAIPAQGSPGHEDFDWAYASPSAVSAAK